MPNKMTTPCVNTWCRSVRRNHRTLEDKACKDRVIPPPKEGKNKAVNPRQDPRLKLLQRTVSMSLIGTMPGRELRMEQRLRSYTQRMLTIRVEWRTLDDGADHIGHVRIPRTSLADRHTAEGREFVASRVQAMVVGEELKKEEL